MLYGNIGGGHRLDFTCIGPAVNMAARMEKLAGQLGRTILASTEFASHASEDWIDIGEYPVAGFTRPPVMAAVLLMLLVGARGSKL